MAKHQCLEISLFLVVVVLCLACSESQPCQAGKWAIFYLYFLRELFLINYIYIVIIIFFFCYTLCSGLFSISCLVVNQSSLLGVSEIIAMKQVRWHFFFKLNLNLLVWNIMSRKLILNEPYRKDVSRTCCHFHVLSLVIHILDKWQKNIAIFVLI